MAVATVPTREEFARLADPYRRELLALPLPTGLGGPSAAPEAPLVKQTDLPWLEPVPDAMVAADETDPAVAVASRQSIRLAFVAALQHLPPRQRAVLILRDVLRFRTAEVAEAVDITTTAVNSLLQRARAAHLERAALREDDISESVPAQQRELLDRYVSAFERYDVAAIVELLTADAIWEMPPYRSWFRGGEAISRLIELRCPAEKPGDLMLVPTSANGQPAFGAYLRDRDGRYRAYQLQVLTVTAGGISHAALFFDVSLFPIFGLPPTQPARP